MVVDRIAGGLIALGALLSVVPAIGGTTAPVALVAHGCGLAAGYAVAILIVLMARVPWLERTLGTAVLLRWHAAGGRAVLVLAVTHAVAATSLWHDGFVRLVDLPGLATALAGTALLVIVGATSARAVRRALPHETWHLLHLVTYLAIGLCFTHQLGGPDLAGRPGWQIAWALLYAYAFAITLRYRLIEAWRVTFRHRLVVDAVVRESADVVTIVMRGRHLHELGARPGQYFRWRFLTAGSWRSAHPFSLSSAPDGRWLRITVKALGHGSRRLLELRPGVRVLASGPYGRVRPPSGRPALLIAGGVGITPIRALFETMNAPGITLLYRASTPADVLFRLELDAIARWRGARLMYLIGSASEPRNAMTAAMLTARVPALREHDVFVCASPRLSAAVRSALDEAGVPRRRVHVEPLAL